MTALNPPRQPGRVRGQVHSNQHLMPLTAQQFRALPMIFTYQEEYSEMSYSLFPTQSTIQPDRTSTPQDPSLAHPRLAGIQSKYRRSEE